MEYFEDEVFLRGHESASESNFMIVGLGSIGSNLAMMMANSFKYVNLFLVDPDKVEMGNLGRTPYLPRQIGKPKAIALAELIYMKRPDILAIPKVCRAEDIPLEIYRKWGHPIVIDCRDCITPLPKYFYVFPYRVSVQDWKIQITNIPLERVWGQTERQEYTASITYYQAVYASCLLFQKLRFYLYNWRRLDGLNDRVSRGKFEKVEYDIDYKHLKKLRNHGNP